MIYKKFFYDEEIVFTMFSVRRRFWKEPVRANVPHQFLFKQPYEIHGCIVFPYETFRLGAFGPNIVVIYKLSTRDFYHIQISTFVVNNFIENGQKREK